MANTASFSSILFPSTVVTATGNTTATNGIAGIIGALFFINISAISGTLPTLTLTLQVLDPASGNWINLVTESALNSTGETVYTIYPNASGAIYQVLPAQYRWHYAIGGTTPSITFSIGVCYLP